MRQPLLRCFLVALLGLPSCVEKGPAFEQRAIPSTGPVRGSGSVTLGDVPASSIARELGLVFAGEESLVLVKTPGRLAEALGTAGYDIVDGVVIGPSADRVQFRLSSYDVSGVSSPTSGGLLLSQVQFSSVGLPELFIGRSRRERADVVLPEGPIAVRFVDRSAGLSVRLRRELGVLSGDIEISTFRGDDTLQTRTTFRVPPGTDGWVKILDVTQSSADLAAALTGVGLRFSGTVGRVVLEVQTPRFVTMARQEPVEPPIPSPGPKRPPAADDVFKRAPRNQEAPQ